MTGAAIARLIWQEEEMMRAKGTRNRGTVARSVAVGAAMTAALVTLAATAGEQPEGRPSGVLIETGQTEYTRYCAACHGVDARGNGPVAEVLRTAPPDLTRITARHGGKFPAGDVAAIIDGRFDVKAHGTREMPVWGQVLGVKIAEGTTEDEVARGRIDALVAYLQSIQR